MWHSVFANAGPFGEHAREVCTVCLWAVLFVVVPLLPVTNFFIFVPCVIRELVRRGFLGREKKVGMGDTAD